MRYIGQTGRLFRVRFQEHFQDFKYGNNKSKFAMHLLENKHSIDYIENIMKDLYITNKCHLMDTTEKLYVYKETKNSNEIKTRTPLNQT